MEKETSLLKELAKKDKWSFDKVYLSDAIAKGKEALASNKLSRRMKQHIRIDIETFERFIQDDFEFKSSSSYKVSLPNDIDKLKEYILSRMSKQYKMLGESLIKWVIDLSDARIFKDTYSRSWDITEIPLEEQVELIIKNYENNSTKFLESAKKIILEPTVKQIQVLDFCDPYCHYDAITQNSYLIIDTSETACLFNHEVQHAVENQLRYNTNRLYWELGPIYYEMLFNEELYKSKGSIKVGDYAFRLDDAIYLLDVLYGYLKILLLFAEKNFNISTKEFLNTFQTTKKIRPNLLDFYLREEVANDDLFEDMKYIFSILKAIELREKRINSATNQQEVLESYLKRKRFQFQIPQDGFKVYERFIEEMNQKVRTKSK